MDDHPVDPQVTALLERFARAGVRPVSEQTPGAARRAGLRLMDAMSHEAGTTAIVRHLNRTGPDTAVGIAAALGLGQANVAARIEALYRDGVILLRPDPTGDERWSVRIGGRRRARAAGGALDRLLGSLADDEGANDTDAVDDHGPSGQGLGLPGGILDFIIDHGLEARVYRPDGPAGAPLPAVFFIHGGGWVIGGIASYDALCRTLMAGSGCVVVSVHYRLAPEHPFPAAIDDVERIWRWLLERVDQLGIDGSRIAVMGDSVGGGMAAVLTMRVRDEGWGSIAAQVLAYPVTDATRALPSYARFYGAPLLSRADMEWYFGHYGPPPGDWRASPLEAPDHSRLPPALVVIAEIDPTHDDGSVYAERLMAAGVDVQVDEYPGMVHGFLQFTAALAGSAWAHARIAAWLRDVLGLADPLAGIGDAGSASSPIPAPAAPDPGARP